MIYIFLGDKNDVQEFVSILNNFDENLEFTLEINFSRVHFLDIKNEDKLITTLSTKDTDRNTLLIPTSFHHFLKKGGKKSEKPVL